MLHALLAGLTRAVAAPVVLAGAIAVLIWLRGPADARMVIAGFVLWSFLSGGTIDRYARARPTRARGFFAACGGHFPAMARLGLIVAALNAAVHFIFASRMEHNWVRVFPAVLLAFIVVTIVYGQARLVIEDRRSAIGALLAGWRFMWRHPGAIVLGFVYLTGLTAAWWLPPYALEAAVGFLVLAMYASAAIFFQSRLAHAGYTAAPPLEWPESPAAEAIANASRTLP